MIDKLILDVGCGTSPEGDVNTDLYPHTTIHRTDNSTINPKLIPNFIKADALHLPFKNDCFELVVSNHVIEHLADPVAFVFELLRVSKGRVKLSMPFKDDLFNKIFTPFKTRKRGGHLWSFNKSWWHSFQRKHQVPLRVDYKAGFVFPAELVVTMNVRKG